MNRWLQLIQGYRGKLSAMRVAVFVIVLVVVVPALATGCRPKFALSDVAMVVGALLALAIHAGKEPRS